MVKVTVLIFLFGVIALRLHYYTPIIDTFNDGQKIRITTTILDTPKNFGSDSLIEYSGIKIYYPADVNISIGDVVEVVGNIEVRLIEGNFRIFSINKALIKKIGSEKSFRVLMAGTRSKVISFLLSWLAGDTGALAAGILVGGDDFMSKNGVLAFRRSGISHIVAASGYNVTVVSAWIGMMLAGFLNRRLVMYIGILSIILYMFIAGGSAAVVRAGLMAMMVLAGKIWGRESDGGWTLVVVSLLMLIFNPGLFGDIGFQLSIAAMVGMIYFAGKSLLSQTLACQITTLPLILHYFGNLSIVAPLANMLFIWPVPIVMPILALSVIAGYIFPMLGFGLSLLSWPLLQYMVVGTNLISSAHWSSIIVNKMSWGWVIVYYLVLFLIKWKFVRSDLGN